MSRRLHACLLLFAALMPGLARADGRIAIWQPGVITAPGHYILTHDIAEGVTYPAPTLEIRSSDVFLDLNGHRIGSLFGTAILVAPPTSAPGTVEIRHGEVRGHSNGIVHQVDGAVLSATTLRLVDLDISGYDGPVAVFGAPVVEIVDCTIHDSPVGYGIRIGAGNLPKWTGVVRDNRVSDAHGFYLSEMVGGDVTGNVMVLVGTSAERGIYLESSDGVRIEGNVIHSPDSTSSSGLHGISLQDNVHRCAVLDNVVAGNLEIGIYIGGEGNLISGNVVGRSRTSGIYVLGSRNTLVRNVVESGSWYGVYIHDTGQYCLVDSNTIEGHQYYGLGIFSANSAYRGNILHNNQYPVTGPGTDAGGNIP